MGEKWKKQNHLFSVEINGENLNWKKALLFYRVLFHVGLPYLRLIRLFVWKIYIFMVIIYYNTL